MNEYIDPQDMQNYREHIADARKDGLIPTKAKLESIYQYFHVNDYVGTVLFMRVVTVDEHSGLRADTPYWLVATPEWESHVFLNAAALYRYFSTIAPRLRYDMYGTDRHSTYELQVTGSVDVQSFVESTEITRKRFEAA